MQEDNEIEEQSGRPNQLQIPQSQLGKAKTVLVENNLSIASSSLSSSSFVSLCVTTTNFTGYNRLLGEETSRNHQAYRRGHLDITIL